MNKLELMNQNKKRYAFVKEHLDDLKTGYDVLVADEVIGPFDYESKFIAIYDAFEDQMAYWYDRFKKEGI